MSQAHSVSARCNKMISLLQEDPHYVYAEAKGTPGPNSFCTGGRDTHFLVIAHDEDGQPRVDESGQPMGLAGILMITTAWNTCLDYLIGLCPKGKSACDRYHVAAGRGELGAVMSQLPLSSSTKPTKASSSAKSQSGSSCAL